jgi:hypothetical protein
MSDLINEENFSKRIEVNFEGILINHVVPLISTGKSSKIYSFIWDFMKGFKESFNKASLEILLKTLIN